MPNITTNTGAVFAISVALATEVKERDQFHIAISKAKQRPPKKRKNLFRLVKLIFFRFPLSSNFIHR